MRQFYLILFSFLISLPLSGQIKKTKEWEFGAHLSIGLNIPSASGNNAEHPAFLTISSEATSNPGFELAGVAYYRKTGFILGFGYYRYLLDTERFEEESQRIFSENSISTYMSDEIKDIPLFAGLSYYFEFNNLYIEPEFLVRYNKAIGPKYADIYFWENNELIESINYIKESNSRMDLVPGIRLSYLYPLTKKQKVGIQFSYHYSISNPEFKYRKKEADIRNGIITEEVESTQIAYTTSNFSFGIILRFN